MAETTVDIIGKGFKYDTEVLTKRFAVTLPSGTIASLVGAASWGKKNEPVRLSSSQKGAFERNFGVPLDGTNNIPDSGGLAAFYYLQKNADLWFTRVTDGTDSKAQKFLIKPASAPKIKGDLILKNSSLTVHNDQYGTANNKISFTFDSATYASENLEIILDDSISPQATPKDSIDTSIYETQTAVLNKTGNYSEGEYIIFSIDGEEIEYRIPTNSLFTNFYTSNEITGIQLPAEYATTDETGLDNSTAATATASFSTTSEIDDTTSTGLNNTTTYDFDINDGTDHTISIAGSSAQTFGDLETAIQNELDAASIDATVDIKYTVDSVNFEFVYNTVGSQTLTLSAGATNPLFSVELDSNTDATFIEFIDNVGTDDTSNSNLTVTYDGIEQEISLANNTINTFENLFTKLTSKIETVFSLSGSPITVKFDDNDQSQIDILTSEDKDIDISAGSTNDLITALNGTIASQPFDENSYAEKWLNAFDQEILDSTSWEDATERAKYIDLKQGEEEIIQLKSQNRGNNSTIEVIQDFKLHTSVDSSTPYISRGSDTIVNDIVKEIQREFDSENVNASIYFTTDGKVVIASNLSSGTIFIQVDDIANSINEALGIPGGTSMIGGDSVSNGKLIATYTGSEGNKIEVKVIENTDGKFFYFFFQGVLQTIISEEEISYVVDDEDFIGNVIENDDILQDVLKFEAPDDVEEIEPIAPGAYKLSGGTSGVENLSDGFYNLQLEKFKNMDLYSIDMIGVPGNVAEVVADKLQEVCEYRKDCYTIIDSPDPNTVEVPQDAIDWHNGEPGFGRSKPLDSRFMVTYWPYVMIPTQSKTLPYQWHGPSVRLYGMIAEADTKKDSKVHVAAGIKMNFGTDIEELAYYLTEEEKKKLYADRYKNNINPLVYSNNYGYFIDGEKTTQREMNSFNRLHTMRVNLYFKKEIFRISPRFFYQASVPETWNAFRRELQKIADYLISRDAIQPNPTIICDATTNTDVVKADQGMLATIDWSPVNSIEKIKVIATMHDQQVEVTF